MNPREEAAEALLLGAGALAVGALSMAWLLGMLLRLDGRRQARAYARHLNAPAAP